jgi:hypothetical protein
VPFALAKSIEHVGQQLGRIPRPLSLTITRMIVLLVDSNATSATISEFDGVRQEIPEHLLGRPESPRSLTVAAGFSMSMRTLFASASAE